MTACECQKNTNLDSRLDPFRSFAELRANCPAINQILIPDDIWPSFEHWHNCHDKVALHRSILLLAFQRGYLGRITSSIHKFLLEDDRAKNPNYIEDTKERWMFAEDPVKRHRKAKSFNGRLAELQVAEWLQLEGWSITKLEALGHNHDIEATRPTGRAVTFEVKFIGLDDDDFSQIVSCISGNSAGGGVSAYDPVDYLLFRVYEAAHQLSKANSDRIALVVIDELAWDIRFTVQANYQWIDWDNPRFFLEHDFREFLERKQLELNKVLNAGTLKSAINELDEVWILTRSEKFVLERQTSYRFDRSQSEASGKNEAQA